MAEVDKAHQRYLRHGLDARNDAAPMQFLIPGWTFDPKRPSLERSGPQSFASATAARSR